MQRHDAPGAGADVARRQDVLSLAVREDHAAHHPCQAGPADERQDHNEAEVDLQRGPLLGQRGGEQDPQRQRRHRHDDLDHALHHQVHRPREVAG